MRKERILFAFVLILIIDFLSRNFVGVAWAKGTTEGEAFKVFGYNKISSKGKFASLNITSSESFSDVVNYLSSLGYELKSSDGYYKSSEEGTVYIYLLKHENNSLSSISKDNEVEFEKSWLIYLGSPEVNSSIPLFYILSVTKYKGAEVPIVSLGSGSKKLTFDMNTGDILLSDEENQFESLNEFSGLSDIWPQVKNFFACTLNYLGFSDVDISISNLGGIVNTIAGLINNFCGLAGTTKELIGIITTCTGCAGAPSGAWNCPACAAELAEYMTCGAASIVSCMMGDNGGGPTPTGVTELQNGQEVTGISVGYHEWKYFKISVPSGASLLKVEMYGGSGDADLYVRYGEKPTESSYDYRPYIGGNNETVNVNNPSPGDWYIGINGYSSASGVNLKATYTTTE